MTLYELLPSLSGASRPRFDSAMWPVATQYHLGRLTFDGMAAEDIADCMGTPTVFDGVLVTRVRSVIAGIVRIDGTIDDVADAEIASRHSVAGREFFAVGDTKIELPSDVRAGDVLALVLKT